ncbi:GntR family transcriptional regulator [Paractinoplanes globisporus]|uniref:GntR family transcriptional regulator n=1 Tax=Paractinoplanes globisporus TaxID=113565 RepID=A0ABW6WDT8_9ACTN|nr:GntR family transcriptional regulator [Actinoplanes globisporus]
MSQTFRKPPTAQEAVLAELRRLIVTGQLRPGEQIVQDALAAELGVSRVPLREALKILEGEGQVRYVAHRGYFVTQLSLPDLLEVYRIREILEAEAVRVGLPQMTTEDVDRLAEAEREVQAAAEAADVAGMTQANRRFHFALIEACGLPRLVRILGLLWDATEVYRSVYFTEPGNRERVDAEHHELVAAVKAGDIERAVDVLDEHRRHAVTALRLMLEAVAPAGTLPDNHELD